MHSQNNPRSSPEQMLQRPWGGIVFLSSFGLLCVCSGRSELRWCSPGLHQLSATKVKEAGPDRGGNIRHHGSRANPWQNYELHFSYNTLPSFQREPFFYLTPLPLTHRLPLKPLICSIPLITAVYWGPLLPDKEGVPYVLDSSSHCSSFWTALDTCQCSRELASWSFPDRLFISWWDNAG